MVLALLLVSCAPGDPLVLREGVHRRSATAYVPTHTPFARKSDWVGHSADELTDALGTPLTIINVPGGLELEPLKTRRIAYLYYPESNRCVDAYVVRLRTGRILKYYCR